MSSADSSSLLDTALTAHGGLDRWDQLQHLMLDVRMRGNILLLKGRSPFIGRLHVVVDTRRVHAVLTPFPRAGCRGIFDADGVRIETDDGRLVATQPTPRDRALKRRLFWRDVDVLYFLGYALWNYSVTPFVFTWPGFATREGERYVIEDGSTWRTLHVQFPSNVPTHSRAQTFYFDDRGLLRRLDYTAEVFASFAHGVHLCEAHRNFDGFVIPTHRIVHPRRANSAPFRPIRVMEGWVDAVRFA